MLYENSVVGKTNNAVIRIGKSDSLSKSEINETWPRGNLFQFRFQRVRDCYNVAVCVKLHAISSTCAVLMLPLMTCVAQQFEIAEVKRDGRVVDVRGRDVFLVMNNASRLSPALTNAISRQKYARLHSRHALPL